MKLFSPKNDYAASSDQRLATNYFVQSERPSEAWISKFIGDRKINPPSDKTGSCCRILITENILGPQGALPSKNLFRKILIDEFQIVRLSDET